MSAREPFTVRLPAPLVHALRARAREQGASSVAALVEAALRLYLATSEAEEKRSALLAEVEEALLQRLDRRLGRAVEGLRDVAVRANFDQSLTLLLLYETLRVLFSRDQRSFEEITESARKEAAKRLRDVSGLSEAAKDAAVKDLEERIERLKAKLAAQQQEIETLRKSLQEQSAELEYRQALIHWEATRRHWARERLQEQPQGLLVKRKTLEELLEEYERVVPRPVRRRSA